MIPFTEKGTVSGAKGLEACGGAARRMDVWDAVSHSYPPPPVVVGKWLRCSRVEELELPSIVAFGAEYTPVACGPRNDRSWKSSAQPQAAFVPSYQLYQSLNVRLSFDHRYLAIYSIGGSSRYFPFHSFDMCVHNIEVRLAVGEHQASNSDRSSLFPPVLFRFRK